MTADQIREQWNQSMLDHLQEEDLPFATAGILVEIAAQLAEYNAHMDRLKWLAENVISLNCGGLQVKINE